MKSLGCILLTFIVAGALAACSRPVQEAPPTKEDPPVKSSQARNIIANN